MKKQVIRLNESQFNKIVREAVETIINNEMPEVEYVVFADFGYGFEELDGSFDKDEAMKKMEQYRKNDPDPRNRYTVRKVRNYGEIEETFDHHDPEYDEEEAADEMAWRQDAYWDERMDNAINESVKKTIRKNLR